MSWALYLGAALFLLLRAEGFEVNFREATVQETALISASFTHPTQATLGREIVRGTEVEFHAVPPGRQILSLVADGRVPMQVALDAVPRRVSRVVGATLAPLPEHPTVLRTGVRLAAVSESGRSAATLSERAPTIEFLRLSDESAETTASVTLPSDVHAERLQWLPNDALAVLCDDRILLLTPERTQEYLLRERPVSLWTAPGSPVVMAHTESGSLFAVRPDGSVPERIFASVSAVGSSASGSLLIVEGRAVRRIDGTVLGPPLPLGIRARGVTQDAETVHVWDAAEQHWILNDTGTWEVVPGAVSGTLSGEAPLLFGDGTVFGADGRIQLRVEGEIHDGFAWSDDVLLLRRGATLLHCSLALRHCSPLAEDVAQFWRARNGIAVLRAGEFGLLPLDTP